MPKIAAFPKAYMNNLCVDGTMSVRDWLDIAEKLNIDLFEIIKAIKIRPTHSNILNPGLGVGGYCLTKDPLFGEVSAKKLFKFKKNRYEFSTKNI